MSGLSIEFSNSLACSPNLFLYKFVFLWTFCCWNVENVSSNGRQYFRLISAFVLDYNKQLKSNKPQFVPFNTTVYWEKYFHWAWQLLCSALVRSIGLLTLILVICNDIVNCFCNIFNHCSHCMVADWAVCRAQTSWRTSDVFFVVVSAPFCFWEWLGILPFR